MKTATISEVGFTIISAGDAEIQMSEFQKFVSSHSDIKKMFMWNEQPIYGFTMSIQDFMHPVSRMGVTSFVVSFGLEFDENENPRFTLILHGINNDASIQSHYYLLRIPLRSGIPPLADTAFDPQTNAVPEILIDCWTERWQVILNQTEIPNHFCMVDLYDADAPTPAVLKRYSFQRSDLLNTLYPVKLDEYGFPVGDPQFCFYLINHSNPVLGTSPSDVIGLMMGVTAEMDGERKLISSFYDFSAPCPPTCPE
jgi:hypothetical protein